MSEQKENPHSIARMSDRVEFFGKVKLLISDSNEVMDLRARNLSLGGMFLRCTEPLPAGTRVALEFQTRAGKVWVPEGQVMWSRITQELTRPAGMGIRFEQLSEISTDHVHWAVSERLLANKETIPAGEISAELRKVISRIAQEAVQQEQQDQECRPGGTQADPPTLPVTKQECVQRQGLEFEPTLQEVTIIDPSLQVNVNPYSTKVGKPIVVFAIISVVFLIGLVFLLTWIDPYPATLESMPDLPETPVSAEDLPVSADNPNAIPKTASVGPKVEIGPPIIVTTSSEYQIQFRTSRRVEVSHFQLESPSRIVLDFQDTTYTGQRHALQTAIPFVGGIRVGQQENYTRYVIDIRGPMRPFEIEERDEDVTIHFVVSH